jgi:hypothetical protein
MLNPSLKMSWAKRHLNILKREIDHFANGDTYRVREKDDLEAGEYVIQIELAAAHADMGMILGDFLNCLRGSLDHLAFQLTMIPDGTRNERASFPVIGIDNRDGQNLFNRSVDGIPDVAVKVIRAAQPYHDGNAYEAGYLWKLHRLWNIDKHRRVPFHATVAKVPVTFPSDVRPAPGWANDKGVVRFPISAKGKVRLDPSIKPAVQFGDEREGIIVTYSDLVDIHEFVCSDLVPRFQGFFEKIVITR